MKIYLQLSIIVALIMLVIGCTKVVNTPVATTANSTPTPHPINTENPTLIPPSHVVVPIPPGEAYPNLEAIRRGCPRIDGSTSTYPLRALIICRMFNVPCGWSYRGERAIVPVEESKEADMLEYVIQDRVWNNGTHGAYVSLAEKQTDIIIVARPPSIDEIVMAREKGFEFDVRSIAKDALVFLINIENPVESLTVEEVQGIYQGTIGNWQQLGWEGRAINAYQRDENSGSQELMNTLVMKGTSMVKASSLVLDTMSGPINAIHSDISGIGYSVYYYSVFMLPDENVKLIGVNSVKPTAESIASRNYPLTTEVYVVMRTNGWRALAPELRDWLSTGEGQAVIRESGYVPLP